MRFKMYFELEQPKIDIQYRKSIISYIKHAIQEYNENLFNQMYSGNNKKTFTWAPILSKPKFEQEEIILQDSQFSILFSAYDYLYALHIYNAFYNQKFKKFSLNKNSMTLKNIVMIPEKEVNTNKIRVKMVSPIEAHPYFPQNELKEKLKDIGTRVMAWYPLGHGDASLREEKVFTELAEKYNKSNVQIILRWHVQSGNIVIPGATKEEHIKANIDIFDFELTDEEMQGIAKINKNKRYYIPDPAVVASYSNMNPPMDEQK